MREDEEPAPEGRTSWSAVGVYIVFDQGMYSNEEFRTARNGVSLFHLSNELKRYYDASLVLRGDVAMHVLMHRTSRSYMQTYVNPYICT